MGVSALITCLPSKRYPRPVTQAANVASTILIDRQFVLLGQPRYDSQRSLKTPAPGHASGSGGHVPCWLRAVIRG